MNNCTPLTTNLNGIAMTAKLATRPSTCWRMKRPCNSFKRTQSSTGKPFGGFSDLWLCGSSSLHLPSSASSKLYSLLISVTRFSNFISLKNLLQRFTGNSKGTIQNCSRWFYKSRSHFIFFL